MTSPAAATSAAYNPRGYLRQLAACVGQPNRTRHLRNIKVPTLVMHGLNDPLVNVSRWEGHRQGDPGRASSSASRAWATTSRASCGRGSPTRSARSPPAPTARRHRPPGRRLPGMARYRVAITMQVSTPSSIVAARLRALREARVKDLGPDMVRVSIDQHGLMRDVPRGGRSMTSTGLLAGVAYSAAAGVDRAQLGLPGYVDEAPAGCSPAVTTTDSPGCVNRAGRSRRCSRRRSRSTSRTTEAAPPYCQRVRTDRLEAFSDGVIAIIITIMVLELPKSRRRRSRTRCTTSGRCCSATS